MLALSPVASAANTVTLMVDGVALGNTSMATLHENTTYASLRAVTESLDEQAVISWDNGTAHVKSEYIQLSARPGANYLMINGEKINISGGVILEQGRTLVPVRLLAEAFGASVQWDQKNRIASINSKQSTADKYDPDDLYWLSRIISAESRGEPLNGKIAVGNVVLNRVKDKDFPDTIYDVIFDDRWGGQFEPVRNGTVYMEPTEESIEAAKLCLDGVNVIGECLYFIAPAIAQNFWVPNNREFHMNIGCHDFYL